MSNNNKIMLLIFCLVLLVLYSGHVNDRENFLKPATNDHYNFIAINEVLMYVSNNGDGSHDPATDGNGFYWPGGRFAQDAAIFEDGLLWGGIVDGQIRVNGNTHFQGLQAGKILSPGVADNPELPKYRVYKIRKDWNNHQDEEERLAYEKDFNEWPVEDGAPWIDVDGDGIFTRDIDQPEFVGDEVLWYVSNDLDPYRSRGTYGSDPIGLEFQTTVWGYNRKNFLDDVVFKKYLVINKGNSIIDSMYFSYWTDDDLGNASDDFVGCDTLLNLGFCYNGDNTDGDGAGITYGINPPAVGHMFVQGPIIPGETSDKAKYNGKWLAGFNNLPLTAFVLQIGPNTTFRDPYALDYRGTLQIYNYMQGLVWNGNPFIDPLTNQPTKFCVPGDPVTGEGWQEYSGWPDYGDSGDRRYIMTSGPCTMAPGDTQEVVIAILMGRGNDYLDSITELRNTARSTQISYNYDFDSKPVMDQPEIKSAQEEKTVMLYWDNKAEEFDEMDPILDPQDVDDKTYSFEGYRIWQFRDAQGTDPHVIATFDKGKYGYSSDGITVIYDWQMIDGSWAYIPVIQGEDTGIRHSHTITESVYDNQPLNNGNPYYFAVTAYAYSEHSYPHAIESEPKIVEVIPGLREIDQTSVYEKGDRLIADHISGKGDGSVELTILDPSALTNDEYRVVFNEDGDYTFINSSMNDTIIDMGTDYRIDSTEALIIDGFSFNIFNDYVNNHWERPSLEYFIKQVQEVAGSGGVVLDEPIDVFQNQNSTNDWQVITYYPDYRTGEVSIHDINIADAAGFHDYEIRFTSSGSEYYTTGYGVGFTPWRNDDPKATNRVPFEIWDVGKTDSETDDIRLTIKTLDAYRSNLLDSTLVDWDSTWSQVENGDWEPIFAFFSDSTYSEPLPEESGRFRDYSVFKVGKIIIRGNLPEEGTVIRISTVKPFTSDDVFSVTATAPNKQDYEAAKANLDDISVFPNPFFGTALYSGYSEQSFVRFTNLPTQTTIRIFTIGGTYVRRLDKNDDNPWLDWDLKNTAGETVASGLYIAHLEMPNIGEKVMKLAVILENMR
jgi:hypothetical protein